MKKVKEKIKVLFENKNLIAIDKPAGILSEGKRQSVVSWIKDRFCPKLQKLDWQNYERLGLVHRLDKDTSGVLLIAKDPETLAKLQNQFKKRQVSKTYLALILGKPKQKKGEFLSFIETNKDKGKRKSWLIDWGDKGAREAKTTYKIEKVGRLNLPQLKENPVVSLLELNPLTGRTHQLRTQLKQINTPIVGDNLYSTKATRKINQALGLKRQFLHAKNISFLEPGKQKRIKIDSPLPGELKNILKSIKWFD